MTDLSQKGVDAPADSQPVEPSTTVALRSESQVIAALESLKSIDTKASALIAFNGILIAGILAFASQDGPFENILQKGLTILGLGAALVGSLFFGGCLHLFDPQFLETSRRKPTDERVWNAVAKIEEIGKLRRGLFVGGYVASAISVIATVLSVGWAMLNGPIKCSHPGPATASETCQEWPEIPVVKILPDGAGQ